MKRVAGRIIGGFVILLGSSCATSNAGSPGSSFDTADSTGSGVVSAPVRDPERDSVRYGDGRTITARYSDASARLVVVTTVGIAIHDGVEPPRLLEQRVSDSSSVMLSFDGQLLAIADATAGVIEVWDLDDGSIVFQEVANAPVAVGFSVDDSTLVYSTAESVSSWSPDGTSLVIATPPSSQPGQVVASSDGATVVQALTGSASGSILVWTENVGVRSMDLGLSVGSAPGSMVLAGDGSLLIFESPSVEDLAAVTLGVVDLSTGESQNLPIDVRVQDGQSWVLGPEQRISALGSDVFTTYDLSGNFLGEGDLDGLSPSRSISAPADGSTVVIEHEDGSLTVWDLDGNRLAELPATVDAIEEVVRPDGATLLTIGYSGAIDKWLVDEQRSGGAVDSYAGGAVTALSISRDGKRVAFAHSTGVVDLTDVSSGLVDARLEHNGRQVDAVAFSPDAAEVATGIGERLGAEAFDDSVTLWDTTSGSPVASAGGTGESVAGCSFFRSVVRFSPDGELVATSSHDFTVMLHRADNLTPVLTLRPHDGPIHDVVFSPDGRLVATSSEDLKLRISEVSTGRELHEFDAPFGGYWALAFLPDGASLIAVGATGDVVLLRLADGEVIRRFDESASWSSGVALSGDGSLFAAGGKNNEVLIWNVADGSVARRLGAHSRPVNAVEFGAGQRYLMSGSEDGTARRWTLET